MPLPTNTLAQIAARVAARAFAAVIIVGVALIIFALVKTGVLKMTAAERAAFAHAQERLRELPAEIETARQNAAKAAADLNQLSGEINELNGKAGELWLRVKALVSAEASRQY